MNWGLWDIDEEADLTEVFSLAHTINFFKHWISCWHWKVSRIYIKLWTQSLYGKEKIGCHKTGPEFRLVCWFGAEASPDPACPGSLFLQAITCQAAEGIWVSDPCWKVPKVHIQHGRGKKKVKMPTGIYFCYVQAISWKNNAFISLELLSYHITIDKLWPSKCDSNGLIKLCYEL